VFRNSLLNRADKEDRLHSTNCRGDSVTENDEIVAQVARHNQVSGSQYFIYLK